MKLQIELFGASFQNPVMLASGTCGFGVELADVMDLDALGGFVTKSVTLEPRAGNPAPRLAEFSGGMLNSIGLANPGLDATRRQKLPWIRANIRKARVFVSIAAHSVAAVISGCRSRTRRPLLAELAPNDPALENTVRVATDAGADGLTLVNTLPGILLDRDGAPSSAPAPAA